VYHISKSINIYIPIYLISNYDITDIHSHLQYDDDDLQPGVGRVTLSRKDTSNTALIQLLGYARQLVDSNEDVEIKFPHKYNQQTYSSHLQIGEGKPVEEDEDSNTVILPLTDIESSGYTGIVITKKKLDTTQKKLDIWKISDNFLGTFKDLPEKIFETSRYLFVIYTPSY
jgi:hypothetical protein